MDYLIGIDASVVHREVNRVRPIACLISLALLVAASGAPAEQIGEVDTVFKFVGPNHKIVVDAHDDPKVKGVTCYVSRAKTGGVKGALGVAEGVLRTEYAYHDAYYEGIEREFRGFGAADVDSLAGMGASGDGSHAPGETVDIPSIFKQAKRTAILLTRLSRER